METSTKSILEEKLQVTETDLKGVLIIIPRVHRDERGYFFDSYDERDLKKYGLPSFVQQSQSFSFQNVVRGLHFQMPPHAQAKLVRVLKGTILDVVVDIRKNSSTFGKHSKIELSDSNFKQVYIPAGFAHGFSVLSKIAIVLYNLSQLYNPASERGIYYRDQDLAIDWKIEKPILSEKDKKWPLLKELNNSLNF